MPKKLKRIYGHGDLHFITFSCYRRLPLLGRAKARSLFVKVLGEVRARYRFALIGFVVMPEHVHPVMSEPKRGTPSEALKALKQSVSRRLRGGYVKKSMPAGQLRLPLRHWDVELPQFWQRRFYDFNVWSLGKVREKLDYMHRNPVTRGLVEHPKDWPWSSWSFYYKKGMCLLRMDGVR
jgi:REP-associated tyrosine transposase